MSKLSKLYKVNHVGVNMNNMYKLLCIKYNDCFVSCIPLCQLSFESPTLFKYRDDIAKTGDKLSLLCRSNTYTPVFKSFTWKLLYKQCVYVSNVSEEI